MDRTLLLNQSYEPIAAISWRRAFCLIMLGKVETLEEYDKYIHSATMSFRMPAVVRLIDSFRRHKKRVKFSKQNIFARDRYRCSYCGISGTLDTLTCDHVLPRSKGGTTCFQNLVTCCKDCNSKKGDKTLKEAGMKLLFAPYVPDWIPIFATYSAQSVPQQWKNFMFIDVKEKKC